jgi:outer membrane protein OmpA-like peptidoglycan-associated protein
MDEEESKKLVKLYRDQTRSLQQIALGANRTTTLRLMAGRPVTVVELEAAAAFRQGGAVLLPGEKGGERSALPGIAGALLFHRDHAAQRLLVAGHDPDEPRSARRAGSVLRFVRGDREGWAADAAEVGRVEDWQQVLAWISSVKGWKCDPGPADGKAGPNTKKALAEHRARWAEATGQPAPSGEVGAADWASFYDAYDALLVQLTGEEAAALAQRRAGLPLVERPSVGCAGSWPTAKTRIRDHAPTCAERVDLLFFAEADVPVLACHPVDQPCAPNACDLYRKGKYRKAAPELPATGPIRVRLTGLLFETDKTFLLPRSLKSIKALRRIYAKKKPGSVLVLGHTDTMGSKSYNLGLSTERAASIRAYLTDDADDWRARYAPTGKSAVWGVREDKHMLSHLKGEDGAPFLTGAVDGNPNQEHAKALNAFRAFSNAKRGTSLPASGPVDGQTRRALCAAYMDEDETTLPAGTSIVVHGCGEFHPAKATADEVAEEENRRVEVILFPGAVTPPARDPCPDPGCPEYPLWLGALVETIDLTDDLASLQVLVRDPFGKPVVGATVAIEGAQGADQGTTDAEGRLLLEDELPGTYRVKVSKQGFRDQAVDAEAPGLVEVVLEQVAPSVGWRIPGTVFLAGTACPGPGALGHLAWIQERADLTPERRIRIFGHTRETGADSTDKALSDRRARAVQAILSADLDAFDALAAEEAWGVKHYQGMLRAVGCDPGPIDGAEGQYTKRATRGFQRDWNEGVFHRLAEVEKVRPDVPVDGSLFEPTRAALREAFLACAAMNGPTLPKSAFEGPDGVSGCSGFNLPPDEDPRGRVEVAVFVETPPEAWPCRLGDSSACQLDQETPPRCRFYREVLVRDDTQVLADFFDLRWSLDPQDRRTVFLSALSPLPDGTAVKVAVHRPKERLPDPSPASWNRHERPDPGQALGTGAGTVEGGVVTIAWRPPQGFDPFDWQGWFADLAEDPDQHPFQPPIFVLEAGERWAWSRPPGHPIELLRFRAKGEGGGTAILDDGSLFPFSSLDGLPRASDARIVAVHLRGHALEAVEQP